MKLIDPPQPKRGTLRFALVKFFVDHINFCEGAYYGNGFDKPDNPLYEFFYKFWLFPFKQNDCVCCNTIRGLLYGGLLGFVLGRLL